MLSPVKCRCPAAATGLSRTGRWHSGGRATPQSSGDWVRLTRHRPCQMLGALQLFMLSLTLSHGSGRGCRGFFSRFPLALTHSVGLPPTQPWHSGLLSACDSQSPPDTPFPVQSLLKHLDTRLGLRPDESPCQGSAVRIKQQFSLCSEPRSHSRPLLIFPGASQVFSLSIPSSAPSTTPFLRSRPQAGMAPAQHFPGRFMACSCPTGIRDI